jgi:hypothetical protein
MHTESSTVVVAVAVADSSEAVEDGSAGINDVPMTLIGGTAPVDDGAGARLAGTSVGVPVAGTVVVPITLIGGTAPVEEPAAAEDVVEIEVEAVSVEAPVAGILPIPMTLMTEVAPVALVLVAGAPVWVASMTPVPITLTWRFPNALTRPRLSGFWEDRQLESSECSTVKTFETVRRTGPDAPGRYAEAKNCVPPGKGRDGMSNSL